MRNISDPTDGLSRKRRLEKASIPVLLPVLEDRFLVLLKRALRDSDFSDIYRFQFLVVLLEIEQIDTHAAAEEVFYNEETTVVRISALISKMDGWKKRLDYGCLGNSVIGLLTDLSGQICTISPMFSAFLYLYSNIQNEDLDEIWFSEGRNDIIEVYKLYHLLLDSIRLLQAKGDVYRAEIFSEGRMDPSLAVLVAFLENYVDIVSAFNVRWQSLQMFYLNEILKVSAREKTSGTTWFSFDPSPIGVNTVIPKDIYLETSTDEITSGYKLLTDISLTSMTVEKMQMIVVERDKDHHPEAELDYATALLQSDISSKIYTPSAIGLSVHSYMFFLGEGKRDVSVLFSLTHNSLYNISYLIRRVAETQELSEIEARYKVLSDAFNLQISTSEGEKSVDRFLFRLKENVGLELTFRLDENFPAIVPIEGQTVPSIRLLINTEAWLFAYSWAREISIKSVRLRVSVQGLRNFQIYNDLGIVDTQQEFTPLGAFSDKGAWLAFGSYEMACKSVKNIEFNFNWLHLPDCPGGLKEYYKTYDKDIDNSSFRGRIDQLQNWKWKPLSETEPLYLFRTSVGDPTPKKEAPLLKNTGINFNVAETLNLPLGIGDTFNLGDVHSGFYRLVLTSPEMGFGTDQYRSLFANVMMYNSRHAKNKRKMRRQKPLPASPLSLLMDDAILNYVAEEACVFTIGNSSEIKISYIRPISDEVNRYPDPTHPIALVEGPKSECNMIVGIANGLGESLIRMYVDVDILKPEIDYNAMPCTHWYYRDTSKWVKLESAAVLRDDTQGLMHSGVIFLQLPFSITDEMIDDDGLFWICEAIHSDLHDCSTVRNIYLNVVEAESVCADDQIGEPYNGALTYHQISPLKGRRLAENDIELRTRFSERIAHRQRLLLPHEYEQFTLQEFDEIAKVKCLPRIFQEQRAVVTLVVIASDKSEKYPLCSEELRSQIKSLLKQYSSPFVDINVINPVYEEVIVFCGVSLKRGKSASEVIQNINEGVKKCIAPWTTTKEPPVFGHSVTLLDIQSCIKEEDQVSNIYGIKLLKLTREQDGRYGLEEYLFEGETEQTVSPSAPWCILVPATKQYVKIGSVQEWASEEWIPNVTFGDLDVEHSFVIK